LSDTPQPRQKKICLNSDRPKNIFGATQIGPEKNLPRTGSRQKNIRRDQNRAGKFSGRTTRSDARALPGPGDYGGMSHRNLFRQMWFSTDRQ
jgi:hypothetical protein